jgi:hypothetical protein
MLYDSSPQIVVFLLFILYTVLSGSLVTTASLVLGLRMEEAASDRERSLECIEQAPADCWKGVVFRIGGWTDG